MMILLLCSEPLVRVVTKEVLEGAGHVVMATGDLGTAVDFLSDCKIDLLITYPYIDNVSGHDAAKYLRAKTPKMGVLIVAGLLSDDRLQYRADLEKFDVFPPPFSAVQLLEKVEEVLRTTRERVMQS